MNTQEYETRHQHLIEVHINAIRKIAELQDIIDNKDDFIALQKEYIRQLERGNGGIQM